MSFTCALRLACLLLVLSWSGSVQAQYLLTSGSAGELQIGTGLPLPVGTAGIFLGGMTPINGGTSCGAGPGGCSLSPDGPGTAFWPPLLIAPLPSALSPTGTKTIKQTLGTSHGGVMIIPPGVLGAAAPGAPVPIAVFPTNPVVFQVATTITYAWPAPAGTVTVPRATMTATFGTTAMVPVGGTNTPPHAWNRQPDLSLLSS